MKKLIFMCFFFVGLMVVAQNTPELKGNISVKSKGVNASEFKKSKSLAHKKSIRLCADTGGNQPLYVLNGKVISSKDIKNVETNSIEKVNVLKGKKATDKYGGQGKNGVIEVITNDREKQKC